MNHPAARRPSRRAALVVVVIASCLAVASAGLRAQEAKPFEPVIGQPGKDVVWVPTPSDMVEKMLDVAEVTRRDYVIDLGSGDGRNVIAAARRGARAHGVEFNPEMVTLSRRAAAEAGVGRRATFAQGDMFQADISRATVMALFLLPSNLLQLRSKLFALSPGSRIVSNTFTIEGWYPDRSIDIDNCSEWCSIHLWIVPAKVEGTWRMGDGALALTQTFQIVSGMFDGMPVSEGRLRGTAIAFTVGDARYTGTVRGDRMEGRVVRDGRDTTWKARRQGSAD